MKKSTLIALLVLMAAAALLLSSCATAPVKPAPEKQAPAAAQPAPEQPAAKPEQAAPAPAPEAAAPAPEAAAPAPEAAAPEAAAPEAAAPAEQPSVLAVWQATGVTVTQEDGTPVDLPEEFTSHPVIVRVLDDTNAELVVGDVGFVIPATYTLTGDSLTIVPTDYENPPQLLIDTMHAMGIDQLPEQYYFTISQAPDGSGVLEADAMGYHMVATWTQIQ